MNDLRVFIDALSFEMGDGDDRQVYDLRLRMGIYEAVSNENVSDIMNKASIAYLVAKNDKLNDVVYFSPALLDESNHRKRYLHCSPRLLKPENSQFIISQRSIWRPTGSAAVRLCADG